MNSSKDQSQKNREIGAFFEKTRRGKKSRLRAFARTRAKNVALVIEPVVNYPNVL